MDDQQTYLLNGLLSRNFGLGRIVRFRQVARGRQAETFEVLTQGQHEYVVYLYPAGFGQERLNFAARAMNLLDKQRFSLVPMLPVKSEGHAIGVENFVAEGPQGTGMMVGLATTGSPLPAEQYSEHDISQLGLRLAWMHRLLAEQLGRDAEVAPAGVALREFLEHATGESLRFVPTMPANVREHLISLAGLDTPTGWAHGDIHPAALLLDSDRQLRTVVDFGFLHFGSPHEDLIDALISLCMTPDFNFHPRRARVFLESYDSLMNIKRLAWSPVVARWLAHRLMNAAAGHRSFPKRFGQFLAMPEDLATAIASRIA